MDEIFTSNNQKYNAKKTNLLHRSRKSDLTESFSVDQRLASLLDQELVNPREQIIKHLLQFSKSL